MRPAGPIAHRQPFAAVDAATRLLKVRDGSAEPASRLAAIADAPSVETLRAEVRADPHGVPPSLVDFAADAHDCLRAAMASQDAADAWMDEVSAVLRAAEPVPEVVAATYLEQARELAQAYPSLASAVDALWREASERVRHLAGDVRS